MSKTLSIILLVVSYYSSNLYAQTPPLTQWLPLIGTGAGFSTEINLTNNTNTVQTVNIASFAPSGESLAILSGLEGAVSSNEVQVPARGNRIVTSIIGGESLQVGWVSVSGEVNVSTTLQINNSRLAAPNRMQFSTSPPKRKMSFAGQSGQGRDTTLSIMAPPDNSATAQITLNAISQEGDILQTVGLQMPPGRMGFLVLADLMPNLGEFDGSVSLISRFPVVIQALREDGDLISSLRLLPTSPDPLNTNNCGRFSDWETSDFVLPFPVGTAYEVNQANCSGFGHNGIFLFGYDFIMNIGTPVSAARPGVVIFTNENIPDGNRAGTNLITIRHADGTVALYSHLTINGVLVEPGQSVEAGDVIGLSGDTGNTGGLPHLHFSLHACASLPGLPGSANCPSIPATFRNTQANPFGLNARVTYTAGEF